MAPETEVVATERKHTRKAKAKGSSKKKKGGKKKSEGAGRKSAFSGKRISKLVRENPRREGTHGYKSFSKIKSGMTFEAYRAAGGRVQDLAYDVEHKFVKVR